MNTKVNTKVTAEAKAEAKAKATAERLMAEPSAAEALSLSVRGAKTTAEHLAAASDAARFVAEAEADAFGSIVTGRMLIAEAIYGAAKANMLSADANVEVPAAGDLTWTKVAASAFPAGKATKDEYEALTLRQRPNPRSWSALAEDWALFVNCADGRWRDAYDLSRGESAPSVRGYLTFARQARAAEAAADAERGTESAQARGAVTKAKAKAEAERQAKAKADAATKRAKDAKDAAQARLDHISHHPAASVVTGFPALSGAALTECRDLTVLDALIATVTAWRDHVATMTPAERGEAQPEPATEAIVADAAAQAEAEAKAKAEAESDAMLDAFAERLMARMAAKG